MVLLRERTRPELGTIEPCLPSPAKAPPSGPGWLHESERSLASGAGRRARTKDSKAAGPIGKAPRLCLDQPNSE
jgi:hypothetical protein